jgi:hypothetical protein
MLFLRTLANTATSSTAADSDVTTSSFMTGALPELSLTLDRCHNAHSGP